MTSGGALAIFVKTPGLSPVKTRLASSIGQEAASKFYELSVAATAAIAKEVERKVPSLKIYWAVAEEAGLDAEIWKSFPVIFQGNGTLGDRLSFVYRELLSKHSYVCFIGADSPHLSPNDIEHGLLLTRRHLNRMSVLGETTDGGFYFFGSSIAFPPNIWLEIAYSTDQTAAQLKTSLARLSGIELLKRSFDIDTVEDLRRYSELSFQGQEFLPEQVELIKWSRKLK